MWGLRLFPFYEYKLNALFIKENTMKKLIVMVLSLLPLISVNAQDENFWIFLCFGQSNMAGSAPIEKQDSIVPDRFMSLSAVDGTDGRKMGEWRKALPPICRQDTKFGPLDYFGREMLKKAKTGTRIGVVSVAVEGCPIDFFDKDACAAAIAGEKREWMNNILDKYGRNPYKRLVDMARIAKKDGVIKGILLHQGETDARDAKWQKKVYKIYKDLQNDLELDSFSVPMFVGEVVRSEYNGVRANANTVIDDLVNRFHNVYVVSSEGCVPLADNLHFSHDGYVALGKSYATRFWNRQLERPAASKVATKETKVMEVPTISVEVGLGDNGILSVKAMDPMEKIEVKNSIGNIISTLELKGSDKIDINLKDYPDDSLTFVFYGVNGATTTLKME